MAEHQRRFVVRWLKERLAGRPNRADLMQELKRWLYEHRILIPQDRTLTPLLLQAARDVETTLADSLVQAFSEATLDRWGRVLPIEAVSWIACHQASSFVSRQYIGQKT
jgi:hypothetical protein